MSPSASLVRRLGLAALAAVAIGAAAQADPVSAGWSLEHPPYSCGGCVPPPTPEHLRDSDGDGLRNGEERAGARRYGGAKFPPTDPAHPDTDGDGLSDYREVTEPHKEPPRNYGGPLRVYHTNPTVWDTDGDRHSDGLEVLYTKTHPVLADTDRDGLTDGAEGFTHRTNARKADTDGDGCNDGREVRLGSDPRRHEGLNPCMFRTRVNPVLLRRVAGG